MLLSTMASWAQSPFQLLFVRLLQLLKFSVIINCILALFNLIPIPPLDGSKMIYASLKSPESIAAYKYFAQFGIFILIGFLWFDGFYRIVLPVVARLYALLELPLPAF